jgi:hypothetical protein
MSPRNILDGFESLIENLSIDLRYEKGDFSGGLCRLPEKNIFIINNRLSVENKIRLIASELRSMNLNHIYIRPALRKIIDDEQDFL